MRQITLSGREANVIRVLGFSEAMLGGELQENTHMDSGDLADTLNGLISAGLVETVPCCETISLAEMPAVSFEVNPAYVGELRRTLYSR